MSQYYNFFKYIDLSQFLITMEHFEELNNNIINDQDLTTSWRLRLNFNLQIVTTSFMPILMKPEWDQWYVY